MTNVNVNNNDLRDPLRDLYNNNNDLRDFPTNLNCFDPNPTDLDTLDENFDRYHFIVFLGDELKGLIVDLSKDLYPKNSDFETFGELLHKREVVERKLFNLIVQQSILNFPNEYEKSKTFKIQGCRYWSGKYGSDFKIDTCFYIKFDVDGTNKRFIEGNSKVGDQLEEGKDFLDPRFYSMDKNEQLKDDIGELRRRDPNNIYWSQFHKETN